MDEERLEKIKQKGNLPRHIAIIMDGNGRWAKKRGLPRVAGHREGIQSVRSVVELCTRLGIEVLTLYTFSTENWRRPREEISALMGLLVETLRKEIKKLMENNIRFTVIGNTDRLPSEIQQSIQEAMEATRHNTGLILNLALSYGAREEIVHAVKSIAQKVKQGVLDPEDISQEVIQAHLYTAGLPDPDLLIRTSGESRVSNFLLWQLAYTEIYITNVLWPDFRENELCLAIEDYQGRERRFGKVSEQLQETPQS